MIDASTVVWIEESVGPGAAASGAPSEEARRALAEWAKARGVTLEAPSESDEGGVAVDLRAADRVERALARARDALVAVDLEKAEAALGEAGQVLRDHPELPQAAWLRAEVERAWASRWLRDPRPTKETQGHAAAAWRRAAALDGGRAAGLGEQAIDAPLAVHVRLVVTGDARGSEVRIDGERVESGELTRAAGEHDVVVARADGTVTWAAWVPFADGDDVRVFARSPRGCSRDDVGRARIEMDQVDANGVGCARWVAAESLGDGSLRVATCEASRCGPLVEWHARLPGGPVLPVEPPRSDARGLPTWATLTLAGVAVGGAALAAVLATSAFKPAPTETRFVDGGLQIHSF
jgi:hypothetical protein